MFKDEAALLASFNGSEAAELLSRFTGDEEAEIATALAGLEEETPEEDKERISNVSCLHGGYRACIVFARSRKPKLGSSG